MHKKIKDYLKGLYKPSTKKIWTEENGWESEEDYFKHITTLKDAKQVRTISEPKLMVVDDKWALRVGILVFLLACLFISIRIFNA